MPHPGSRPRARVRHLPLPILAAILAPDEKRDGKRTEGLREAHGAPDLTLAAYRSGRILQRAGRLEEALAAYGRAMSLDPASPEPIVRSIEGREAHGEPGAAEALAREALERGGFVDDGGIWAEWSLVTFRDLRRPLTELAAWLGRTRRPVATASCARPSRNFPSGSGAHQLGGPRFEASDGKVWSADCFARGHRRREEPKAPRGLRSRDR